MEDKVIVSHRAALTAKYGPAGIAKVKAGLAKLIAADKARGLNSRVVYLDDVAAMKRLGATAVGSSKDVRGAKIAIDAIYKALKPDYLMIVGASDIVPHQDLTNPAYKKDGDDDPTAFGDLPYACNGAYGRDTATFVGPTRVVGRLPDLTDAKEPSYLLALLNTAAKWKGRKADSYADYFGLSASVWKGSTGLSLNNIFGNDKKLQIAPPAGPNHPSATLGTLMHFINCHGDVAVPEYYGQKGNSYPVSLSTKSIRSKIGEGTIVAAECCYGAQLYKSITLGIDMPICQSYLFQGAYAFLGSTTIAYGPADGNGSADLLCQYFLLNILDGASTGRAALMARQQFVAKAAQMDPFDLKTLAQFCLYGDPSIHPVITAQAAHVPKGWDTEDTARFRRGERRAKLKQTGDFLQATKPTASKRDRAHRTAPHAKLTLSRIATENGLRRTQDFTPFKVKGVKAVRGGAKKLATAPSRYYVTVGWPRSVPKADAYRIAIVAKEVGGRIVDYCIYHEH